MPLEPLWRLFFVPDLSPLYSIYIHPAPEFDCAEAFPRAAPGRPLSPFHGRCMPKYHAFLLLIVFLDLH